LAPKFLQFGVPEPVLHQSTALAFHANESGRVVRRSPFDSLLPSTFQRSNMLVFGDQQDISGAGELGLESSWLDKPGSGYPGFWPDQLCHKHNYWSAAQILSDCDFAMTLRIEIMHLIVRRN
jgi:hypothetical protein